MSHCNQAFFCPSTWIHLDMTLGHVCDCNLLILLSAELASLGTKCFLPFYSNNMICSPLMKYAFTLSWLSKAFNWLPPPLFWMTYGQATTATKKLMSTALTENFLFFSNMTRAGVDNPHRPSIFRSSHLSIAPVVYHVQLAICHAGIIIQKECPPLHHNPSVGPLSKLTSKNQTSLFSTDAAVRM